MSAEPSVPFFEVRSPAEPDVPFVKKRAPTLYVIIAIKLLKGVLLLLLAMGVYSLWDNNLPEDFRHLLTWLHIDPERRFFIDLAEQLKHITPTNIYWVAFGTALYSLFCLVEGIGLMFRIPWAGYMAIGEGAFFIPIEIYELMHGFRLKILGILALNVAIVWYLFTNRRRLFRHHVHRPQPAAGGSEI
jgi:uncharacterized membrane protein (DUF2068 family)